MMDFEEAVKSRAFDKAEELVKAEDFNPSARASDGRLFIEFALEASAIPLVESIAQHCASKIDPMYRPFASAQSLFERLFRYNAADAVVHLVNAGVVDPVETVPNSQKTCLEYAVDQRAPQVVEAMLLSTARRGVKLDPLYRLADGRTIFEKLHDACSVEPRLCANCLLLFQHQMIEPTAYLSSGRTVFELCASCCSTGSGGAGGGATGNKDMLKGMVQYCGLSAMQRTPEGRTIFEALLACGAADVCELLVKTRGEAELQRRKSVLESGQQPTWTENNDDDDDPMSLAVNAMSIASSGNCLFEVSLDCRAFNVSRAFVDLGSTLHNFNGLSRVSDGRTLFERAFDAGGRDVALAMVESGAMTNWSSSSVPQSPVLLSDGRTLFEHALRNSWSELGRAVFQHCSIDPLALMSPGITYLDAVLARSTLQGMGDVALAMAKSPLLDPMRQADVAITGTGCEGGKTVFERVLALGAPPAHAFARRLVYHWVETGQVLPTTKLPDGRSCIDLCLSSGAKDVVELMVKRILSS
ncbi:hypothetical protein Pelo_11562 [Pelomyxa schiedti]|nr:hypothetical protein Pelo_11562 [Pelomyxa schiedti]